MRVDPNIIQMQSEGMLKAFIDLSKQVDQHRGTQRIEELELIIQHMERQHKANEEQNSQIRSSLQSEVVELKLALAKIQSENAALQLKNDMLERIVKNGQKNLGTGSMNDSAVFRIVAEENKLLKSLLKEKMADK